MNSMIARSCAALNYSIKLDSKFVQQNTYKHNEPFELI